MANPIALTTPYPVTVQNWGVETSIQIPSVNLIRVGMVHQTGQVIAYVGDFPEQQFVLWEGEDAAAYLENGASLAACETRLDEVISARATELSA